MSTQTAVPETDRWSAMSMTERLHWAAEFAESLADMGVVASSLTVSAVSGVSFHLVDDEMGAEVAFGLGLTERTSYPKHAGPFESFAGVHRGVKVSTYGPISERVSA